MSDPTTACRTFVSYIDKSRDYYAAQGYESPYCWARFDDVPFTALTAPLASLRVGIVTTATLLGAEAGGATDDRPLKQPYAAPLLPIPQRLYTMDLSWDKEATHTDDIASFFPARALLAACHEGRVGGVSPRFYGLPTEYSQRTTKAHDAPAILQFMREDKVDAALLVPL
jgi:hypothetical protein